MVRQGCGQDQNRIGLRMTKIPMSGFFVDDRSHLFAIRKRAALLTLGQRPETYSIPLQCGELAPTLEELSGILGFGVRIRGRHDSEIHLGKLRWEFTGVPHRAEKMMGGRALQVSISVGDAEGVGRHVPNLGDRGAFFYEDTVPPQALLIDKEWREQERERIQDAHEWAMIEDEPEVFREEVDLTIDHGPLLDCEIYSLRTFPMYLFREFLFVDRSKGRAHMSVVWATRWLDYLERVAWGPTIVGWLHHHLCSVVREARYMGGFVRSSSRSESGSTSPFLALFPVA
ncbi:hypothetical protein AMTR_s00190p00047090 [Amborella trichopoda]|uniref:Aminotransferase-like plant mobile domain-containing protein n=1 Tax=Amborella trichopoda TaxID=13333 RepID=U5CYN6_AMBTC|nr:hypothetical protein AMTR_s00190p00047090 [Amborella trichopoda]